MKTTAPLRFPSGYLRKPASLLALAGLLGFSSLSHAGLFSDSQARTQLNIVAQDSANLKAQMQSQNSDLQRQISELQKELAQLRGQEGAVSGNLASIERRQRDIYIDLDNRLKSAEKAATAPALATAGAAHDAPVMAYAPARANPRLSTSRAHATTPTARPASLPALAQKDAQQAFDAVFEKVQMQDRNSIPILQHFISQYPESAQAASAQYWIGYLYYTKGFFKKAAVAQEQLIQRYPDSAKVPHAMYNLALCRLKLKDRAGAQRLLTEVAEKYPTSNNAVLARKKLAEIGGAVISERD